jgi:1-deoxy-D-xylulose-5-phosphate synthase
LVGADGPTHAGSFDIAYLACLPHMVVMAPSNGQELAHAVATAAAYDSGPIVFRYPRGTVEEKNQPQTGQILPIGQGRLIQKGHGVALLSLGTRLRACLDAAELLKAHGLSPTIADARFAKPLDETLILDLASQHSCLITVEEGSIGGFGSHVLHLLTNRGVLDQGALKVRSLCLPDVFIEHDTMDSMYKEAQLDADSIAKTVLSLFMDHKEHRQAS